MGVSLFLSLFLVVFCNGQTTLLWKTTTYSGFVFGCGGTPNPLYFEAFPDPTCAPVACFCTTGTGSACKTVACVNVTSPGVPAAPAGMVGYAGFSDGACANPTQFRAAPAPACSTYGGGSVGASCSLTQLFFTFHPVTPSCSGSGGGTDLTCNVATTTCGASPNLQCGVSTYNTCQGTPTTPMLTTTATTRPAMSTRLVAVSFVLVAGFLILMGDA